jgi:hypothetical protein
VYYGPSFFGMAVEEQRPGHTYLWKRGTLEYDPDLDSWSRAYDETVRIIERKKRPGFTPVAL